MRSSVLVNSNILIDIASDGDAWSRWSYEAADRAAAGGAQLVINPLIYAEVSVAFQRIEDVDRLLPEAVFVREPLPWDAAFLAGKAYLAYRRRGGTRTSLLPDFYIGAHAAVAGHRLLTRDAQRCRTYFPTVELIAP